MIKRIALILSLLPLATLTGCAGIALDCPTCFQTPQQPPPAMQTCPNGSVISATDSCPQQRIQVARVTAIYGTAAFVGSAPAKYGQAIFTGDHFYTGPGTKMEVTLDDGGTIVLDENTDPLFEKAKCFWIRLTSGTMNVYNKREMCVAAGSAKVTQHSNVMYAARGGRVTIAVFEGQVTTIQPAGYTINGGQIFVVQNGNPVGPPRPMSQDVINRLQSWIPRVIL